MTLLDLCNATPEELEQAAQIIDNVKREYQQLSKLGISRQYEVEARDFYNLYLKAKCFPEQVAKVYRFREHQEEMKLRTLDDYEEFLSRDGWWSYTSKGRFYRVYIKDVNNVFELLKYDYLIGVISIFHPSYESINVKKYGDVPWQFAAFVKRTEKLAKEIYP